MPWGRAGVGTGGGSGRKGGGAVASHLGVRIYLELEHRLTNIFAAQLVLARLIGLAWLIGRIGQQTAPRPGTAAPHRAAKAATAAQAEEPAAVEASAAAKA